MAQFIAHVGDVVPLLLVGALLENAQRHFHPRQRRAELMGDVAEKTLLPGKEFPQPRGHVIERAAEPAEFVRTRGGHLRLEAALGDGFRGAGHFAQGAGHSAHQRQPEQYGDRQDYAAADQPGPIVEKQAAAAQ